MSEKYLHEMIDDIEVLIDEAKPARFSPGKITIEKDVSLPGRSSVVLSLLHLLKSHLY